MAVRANASAAPVRRTGSLCPQVFTGWRFARRVAVRRSLRARTVTGAKPASRKAGPARACRGEADVSASVFVGIDVSKATLDVARTASRGCARACGAEAAHRRSADRIMEARMGYLAFAIAGTLFWYLIIPAETSCGCTARRRRSRWPRTSGRGCDDRRSLLRGIFRARRTRLHNTAAAGQPSPESRCDASIGCVVTRTAQ